MLKLRCTHDNVDDTDILAMFIQNSDHNVLRKFWVKNIAVETDNFLCKKLFLMIAIVAWQS